MIISHKHKYIFWKPAKVAGSSVEYALQLHCGDDDVVTPMGSTPPVEDYDTRHYSRNAELFRVC
nr:hypothetical protein [Bacteroidota bacterium]